MNVPRAILAPERVHDTSDDTSVAETSTGAETDAESECAEPPAGTGVAVEEVIADMVGIKLEDLD